MARQDSKLQAIALADQIIESKDGKKSIIGIFDRILVKRLPNNHPVMTLFVSLLGEAGVEDNIKILVESPSEKEISNIDLNFKYGGNGKADLVFNMQGFPIEEVGEYKFKVEYKGKILGSYSMYVTMLNEQDDTTTVSN